MLALTPLLLSAQFSTVTETAYLNKINAIANKKLIENNLPNAEMHLAHLVELQDNMTSPQTAFLLHALSESYHLTGNHVVALQRLLFQRLLFPLDSLDALSANIFYNYAYEAGFDQAFASELWVQSQEQTDHEKALITLTRLCIQLNQKELRPYIAQLIEMIRHDNYQIPYWLQQWEYFAKIGMKEKKFYKQLNFETSDNRVNIFQVETLPDTAFRKKVYRKSISYYSKQKAKAQAKQLLKTYKHEKLNLTESFDFQFKSLKLIF
jgi:hypothetical protein